MAESKNRLLEGINLHDATVTEIRFEGEKVVFEIPRGLVDDEKPLEERRPCKLQFILDDDIEIAYLSRYRFIFGKIRYFSTETSLKELAEMLKKGSTFQIVEWELKDYNVRFECWFYKGRKSRNLLLKLPTRDLEFIED